MIPKTLGSLCVLAVSLLSLPAQDLLFTNNYNNYFSNSFAAAGLGQVNAVAHDGVNSWVAVGDGSNVMQIQFTGSGYSVSSRPLLTNASLSTIIFVGNNKYVAGGRPRAANGQLLNAPLIMVSVDGGAGWVPATVPNFDPSPVPIQGLAFDSGNNRMVAVGALQHIAYANGTGPTFAWTNAVLEGTPFIFESFASVLSLGNGRFVTTGIAEGMRFSTNNGANWWNANPVVSLDDPNMNAAASLDGINLVAIGQDGRVFVSTNQGSSWNTGIASPVPNDLNSIVTLGNNLPADGKFLATGDDGIVLRSTDGLTWTSTNAGAASLRGSFFAANPGGQLAGTGVMIGDNATVVIAGTRPEQPASSNVEGCDSGLAFLLGATTTVDVNLHPANTTAVDWYAADGTTLLQENANNFSTNAISTNPNQPTIYTFFAEARDLRSGFQSLNQTEVTLTVNPRPTAQVSVNGSTTNVIICQGSATNIQAVLTGIGPWNLIWSDGFPQNIVGNPGPGPQIVTRPVNPTVTTIYTVINLTDANNCAARGNELTGSATITLDPIPPTVTCQNVTVNLNASGNATVTPAQLVAAASDNCTVVATNLSQTLFSCANTGTNLVTVTVTDSNGNTNSCIATVVVRDVTPPAVTCQNITVNLDATGNVTVTPAQLVATAGDNCTVVATNLSQATFGCADAGTNLVTVTVTDSSGNTNSCIATVVVRDVTPPALTCTNITLNLDAAGNVTITPAQLVATATDNCTVIATNLSQTEFNCDNVGTNLVAVTVTDSSGNTNFCTATVTVQASAACDLKITRTNSTNVVLEWRGALTLLWATNLTPPVDWVPLSNGVAGGTNQVIRSVIPPPLDSFFRLTNAP